MNIKKTAAYVLAIVAIGMIAGLMAPGMQGTAKAQSIVAQDNILQMAQVNAIYSAGLVGVTTVSTAKYVRLYSYRLTNVNSGYVCYAHFYNNAAPTMGTTNAVITVAIPASSTVTYDFPAGKAASFSNGLTMSVTKAYGSADNTHALAGDVVGFVVTSQ